MNNKETMVTKEQEFELAHFLQGYEGGCAHLHGHSYKAQVTVCGVPDMTLGFVIDFKILKKIINEVIPDHCFISGPSEQEQKVVAVLKELGHKVVEWDFPTSAENMVRYFASEIDSRLPYGVRVHRVKLWETSTSFAEWVEGS